ncbi:uncharacterized protein LOC128683237 [Plodia interpunctella]|uniref:uncharacterized protein LOC128683237 n=1 Tax=Plodia interpunctella TaxID=58824 RepID=UPI0023688B55|nr:uncharacterized protein LOC128683237 [Plodia interpunctella]
MKFLIPDGSELEGVQHSMEIKYMKYVRLLLIMIGAWPGKALGEKEVYRLRFRMFNVFISSSTMITGLIYIRHSIGKLSFFEMGQSYITAMMNFICLTRFITLLASRKLDDVIVDFVHDVHLFNHRNNSEYSSKTNLFIHKLSHFYTIYTLGLVSLVAAFFNVTPLINNISNGGFSGHLAANVSYEHAVYYALPFDYQHDFTGFMIIFTFNWYISFSCGMIFLNYDLIVALVVFHLWGHLKILTHSLQYFPRPGFIFGKAAENDDENAVANTETHYSDEEMVEVGKRLKNIINHHKNILKHSANISEAVGINVAMYYMFHQISGCLLLLECSQLDPKALIRFGPLTICLIQLLTTVSVIFELISSMTDHVVRAAYYTPWECMDTKNRKLVITLLRQTQIPLGLKAMGMVEVGVQTMASILKTTLSYFMMLRTVADNE